MKDRKYDQLVTFLGALAVIEGIQIVSYFCVTEFHDTELTLGNILIHDILDKKPKIQTICEVFENRFLVFHQKMEEVFETFEFENWISESAEHLPKNIMDNNLRINFEIKFDDNETEESYKEHLQRIERQLQQEYQTDQRVIKIKFKQKITIDGKESPIVQYTNKIGCLLVVWNIAYWLLDCLPITKPIILFMEKRLPKRFNIYYWIHSKQHNIEIVTKVSNKTINRI